MYIFNFSPLRFVIPRRFVKAHFLRQNRRQLEEKMIRFVSHFLRQARTLVHSVNQFLIAVLMAKME